MKLTIRDIAEMAGVSVTTVSQILNNEGSRFSDKIREKVLSTVNEHHYKLDYFALNVTNRHSKAIGMVVPDVTDFFFSKLIEGVESYLDPLGYVTTLCNSRHSQENEIKYLQKLSHRSVDGILLAIPSILPGRYALGSGFYQKMSTILTDRRLNRRDNGRLIIKEHEDTYQAVSLFTENGRTKIDVLKEATGYYQLEERFNEYRHTLKDHGLPFNGKFVEYKELTTQGGYTTSKKLLKRKDITAVFCGNDTIAIGCYQAIDELDKEIPEDVLVIGFDGLKLPEYMIPQLATAQQPSFDTGFYTAYFLIDMTGFPQREVPNKVFETKLIIRESVEVLTRGQLGNILLM